MSKPMANAQHSAWTRTTRRLLAAVLLAAATLHAAFLHARSAPKAPPKGNLADGQTVTLTGRLKIEGTGFRQFLMIETRQKLTLAFESKDAKPQAVHEIGLGLAGKNDLLSQFIGRDVTVTGKVQLAPTSPFYWNGGIIVADSVTLPGGGLQRPSYAAPLPDTLKLYKATVTLQPGVYAWTRTAIDIQTEKPIAFRAGMDGCQVNATGSMLSCFCAADFVPVRAGTLEGSDGTQGTQALKLHPVQGGYTQFELDPSATKPLTLQLECARKKDKK